MSSHVVCADVMPFLVQYLGRTNLSPSQLLHSPSPIAPAVVVARARRMAQRVQMKTVPPFRLRNFLRDHRTSSFMMMGSNLKRETEGCSASRECYIFKAGNKAERQYNLYRVVNFRRASPDASQSFKQRLKFTPRNRLYWRPEAD